MNRLTNRLKIRTKLILLNLLIVVLLTTTSLLVFRYGLNTYDALLYDAAVETLEQSSLSIENELIKMEAYTYNLLADKDIQSKMKAIKEAENAFVGKKLADELMTKVLIYTASEKQISCIYFFDVDDFTYVDGINPLSIEEGVKKDVIKSALQAEGEYIIYSDTAADGYVIGARQIRYTEGLSLENLGVVAFRLELDDVADRYLRDREFEGSQLLITSEGTILYDSFNLGKELIESSQDNMTTGHELLMVGNNNYFVAYSISKYSGWKYTNLIPFDEVFKGVGLIRRTIFLAFLIVMVIAILIGISTANNMTKPILALTKRIKKVETGDFGPPEKPFAYGHREDEVAILYDDFEIMIGKIDALIEENYKKQLIIKDTSLKALQAQINPHFLYNTLESINWLARAKGEKEISTMAESLGKLMRNAVDSEEMLITIGKELSLLEAYINIQKFRFEERLVFTSTVGSQYYNYQIPKLTLQPIVENAIKHGLENMLEPCNISVEAYVNEEVLFMVVRDSGPGMDVESVVSINEGKGITNSEGLGIGMQNINKRLKMVFGESYGLEVESRMDQGTTVKINMPLIRSEVGGES